MQTTIYPGKNIIFSVHHPKQVQQSKKLSVVLNSAFDTCGNLVSDKPAIRAKIAEDSKKFREITDLKGRGII